MTLHLTLCYVVLALVFYLPRFGLYLLPFYLSGAVLLLLRGRTPGPRPLAARSRGATWFPALGVALLVGLILASGWRAVADLREALRDAPWETREAGLLLRELGQPGDRQQPALLQPDHRCHGHRRRDSKHCGYHFRDQCGHLLSCGYKRLRRGN